MDSQTAVRRISHYSSDMDILLVGEGDFSFTTALARAFQTAPRLLATSLDSREMLHVNYGGLIMEIRLAELLLRDVVVINEVDVKNIIHHPSLHQLSFDRIIYNFPHSGFVFGLNECDIALIWKHRQLMQSFFKNARMILKEGGEVHVAHHMCMPYSEWRLEEEAAKSGFQLRACHKFEAQRFPGYTPRRGAGANANGTFPLCNPVTFIFFIPHFPSPPCIIPSHAPPPPYIIPPPSPSPSPNPFMTHCHPSITSPLGWHPPLQPLSHFFNTISTPTSFDLPFPPAITPPKPSMIISPSPPPPPPPFPSPINISTHHNNHQSIINSHGYPYIPPPLPFETFLHHECYQPSNLDQSKAFSWISTVGHINNCYIDHTQGGG